jgi:hypothetical protein
MGKDGRGGENLHLDHINGLPWMALREGYHAILFFEEAGVLLHTLIFQMNRRNSISD